MQPSPRSLPSRSMAGVAMSAALLLGGCVSTSAFDDLGQARPTGSASAFSRALFADYVYLARSYGLQNAPSGTAFDAENSASISSVDSSVAEVANAFAAKALSAAKGEDPLPEPAPTDDEKAENLRLRLLRVLNNGRTKAPVEAAKVQSDYDCWILNGTVARLAASSAQCLRAFNASLPRLESRLGLKADATSAPAPSPAPAQAMVSPVDFTVYFALGSPLVTEDGQAVIRQAIDAARNGRQSRISVVGHTDTTGAEAYNLALSRERASAVKAAMVEMGARAEAIETSGVGEADLAVQTADNAAEPRNRRAVVDLIP